MKNKKVIYYEDELNDEFSEAKITPKKIDENYKYIHKNVIWNACAFLLQNIISLPIKYLYAKIKFRTKTIGKEKLKPYKKQGYFIYGNHTQEVLDPFIPTLGNFPRKCHIVAHPDNVSIPILGNLFKSKDLIIISIGLLGAILYSFLVARTLVIIS